MPYICLANTTIPDGVVQINDLLPNVSLRSNTDPAGQNRYVNRAQNEAIKVSPTTGQAVFAAKGLRAYLADRVVPGGNTAPTGTVTALGVQTGDIVTVAGVPFTAVLSGADPAIQEFNAGAPTGTITTLGVLTGDVVTVAGVAFTSVLSGANPAIQQFNSGAPLATVTCGTGANLVQIADTVTLQGVGGGGTGAVVTFTAAAAEDTGVALEFICQGPTLDSVTAQSLVDCINGVAGQAAITASLGGARVLTATRNGAVVTVTGFSTDAFYDATLLATSTAARLAKSGTSLDYPNTTTATSLATAFNDGASQALITAALAPGLTVAAVGALNVVTFTGAGTNPVYATATLAGSDPTRLARSGGTLEYPNLLTATSLTTAINEATPVTGSQALITAALGSTRTIAATNGGGTLTVVTLTAGGTASQYLTLGTLASTNGTREALSGTALKNASGGLWTATQLSTAATNLLARVNSGLALAVGDINTVLAATVASTSLTAGSTTDGALTDILEIMAGREYYVPANAQVYQAAYLPLTIKSAAQGSFTRNVTVFDSQMVNGEIRPIVRTGDVVAYDRKGIRATVDGSAFQLSLAAGTLNHFAAGITLLPDSDPQDPITWTYQTASNATNVASQRIVTVYDNDGSLLA